ncbi:MAG: DUF2786 domain-containing protein [Rhodospirillaceae bacterium]
MSQSSKQNADLEKLKARIQALRSKTVENGCTEEEALSAAAKVADLLDQYDLSLTDIELREEPCERAEFETRRKQGIPLDACIPAIAEFTDCKVWREKNQLGEFRFVFFGMRPDVAVAQYLCELIDVAMLTEVERFKRTAGYRRYHPNDRRAVSTSFLHGMASSIAAKLRAMKVQRDTAHKVTGRDLVVVKSAVVEDELAKLGMNFSTRRRTRRMVAKDAFEAGHVAGQSVAINPGVGHGAQAEKVRGG